MAVTMPRESKDLHRLNSGNPRGGAVTGISISNVIHDNNATMKQRPPHHINFGESVQIKRKVYTPPKDCVQ
jgi:hypothetical protein